MRVNTDLRGRKYLLILQLALDDLV